MKKTAYIIPGYRENCERESYRKVGEFFERRGISIIPIEIEWKYRTMSDYVKQFEEQLRGEGERYYLGFSFGAMISLISSIRTRPKLQILCSLSPYFREDLPFIEKRWRKIMRKRRLNDFQGISFEEIIKDNKSETILLVGENEHSLGIRRSLIARNRIDNSSLEVVENTGHDMSNVNYLGALESVIKRL